MLQELSIKNFAIIDDIRITFDEGLTILSGETGAGKSIIIHAVNLLLGSRASAKAVRTGAETAELEAAFWISPESRTASILKDHGEDPAQGLIIRRIISKNDRHKVYVNGHLATMQLLNAVTDNLASISGQHAHQGLLKEDQHLLILDQFGDLGDLRAAFRECFVEIQQMSRKLKGYLEAKDRQAEQTALLEFQKKEIDQAAIELGEDDTLETERIRLKNSEMLSQTIHGGMGALYHSQGAVTETLVEIQKSVEKASGIDPALKPAAERLADITYQIEDVVHDMSAYMENVQMNEGRLEVVEDRLDVLKRLKKKYGGTLAAVLAFGESIGRELDQIENIAESIDRTQRQIRERHAELAQLAQTLSARRVQAAKALSSKVEKELASLRMAETKFSVSLQTVAADATSDPFLVVDGCAVNENGLDCAGFQISPNVGEALKPLAAIASGGELSRVVLALKAITAETDSVETIVFDEVDAGIGGGVAEVVGKKLQSLARHHQIICITHLPQIAKFGDHHFKISKKVSKGRTHTAIAPIDEETRVEEIARMLGGENITEATLAHARELLEK